MTPLNYEYDIVVVGGGPSGCVAARVAAEKGLRVLLIEKERFFGRKPCAGGLSNKGMKLSGLKPSPKFVDAVVNGFILYSPDESKYIEAYNKELGEDPGYVLNKAIFVTHLAYKAAEAGSDIWIDSLVERLIVKDNFVKGVIVKTRSGRVEVKAKVVIDASGYSSKLSTNILPRGKDYKIIPALQYKMTNVDVHEDLLYFWVGSKIAPEGYAWIFPTGEGTANVGIGVMRPNAREWLDMFIRKHKGEFFRRSKIIKFEAAAVPIGGLIPKLSANGLLVTGDGAGQVIPLTGGGNHSGMAGGKMAAEIAAKAIEIGDVSERMLSEYDKLYVHGEWGQRIKRSYKAMKVISELSDNDLIKLADLLDPRDIIDLANGLNIQRVALKLMKHPILAARVAKRLLS